MRPNSLSVVVIGGGVFGCATAYYLSKRGAKTTLIERDDIGDHASGKNPGNLN
ncbi:MAG: FAD-dependent oxidoreductase, partial [Gallionellaceae bacterium]